MVSTRSHSRLSESSIITGQEKVDVHGEVTSKEAPLSAPRTTRKSRQQQSAALDPIAEETAAPAPRSISTRKKKQPEKEAAAALVVEVVVEEEEEEEEEEANLVDRVADSIFAALEQGFGDASTSASSDSSSDDDDDDVEDVVSMKEKRFQWRPELRLPGQSGGGGGVSRVNTAPPQEDNFLADKSDTNLGKHLHVPPPDSRKQLREGRKNAADTAGKAWFDLPATEITDEVKNDLRVLRLRSAFDPKSFYKKFDSTKFPKYFQFGTVVEGAGEYYSSRMTKKERKRTLTEEIMSDPHLTQVRKKRYQKMQDEAERNAPKRKRNANYPQLKKKPRRSKH